MTDIRVYHPHQIGGCVTVITARRGGEVRRLMIDYGSSLEGSREGDVRYPWGEEPVDAVFFTHYHGDHVGRFDEIPPDVPIYMGDTARRVLCCMEEALAGSPGEDAGRHRERAEILRDGARVRTFHYDAAARRYDPVEDIPGFVVEPYSVDHSAYDAYMFLIEAEDSDRPSGKYVILHTGDFREHGRRGKRMLDLIRSYVRQFGRRSVDALVTEGTMLSRPGGAVLSEPEMQREAEGYLREHPHAFLICSSTNLDSLASFYQAARRAAYPGDRYLYVCSAYIRKQLELFTETAGAFSGVYQFEHVFLLDGRGKPLGSARTAGARVPSRDLPSHLWTQDHDGIKDSCGPSAQAACGSAGDAVRGPLGCAERCAPGVAVPSTAEPPRGRSYTQQELMERFGFLALIRPQAFCEKYIDAFVEAYRAGRIPEPPAIIYSLWEGYLDPAHPACRREWIAFLDRQRAKGVEVKTLHTSGHATPRMLAQVIEAVDPREEIVPMHTEDPGAFRELPIREELKEKLRLA